ncbi:MAG: hypothetical protein R3C59_15780 [Planctomycetaceae bacterium]
MNEEKAIRVYASARIRDEDCTRPGMGDCEVTAVLEVVLAAGEELQGDPTVTVGGEKATVTEQGGSPTGGPGGPITHTYDIRRENVPCGQTHRIESQVYVVVPVSVTPVDVTCPD